MCVQQALQSQIGEIASSKDLHPVECVLSTQAVSSKCSPVPAVDCKGLNAYIFER